MSSIDSKMVELTIKIEGLLTSAPKNLLNSEGIQGKAKTIKTLVQ